MSSHNHSFRRTEVRLNKRHALRVVLLSLGFGTFGLATLGGTGTEWGSQAMADEPVAKPKQTSIVLKPATNASVPLTLSTRTSPIRFNPHSLLSPGAQAHADSKVRPVAGESTLVFVTPEMPIRAMGESTELQRELADAERPGPVLLRPTSNAFVLRPVLPPVLDPQTNEDLLATADQPDLQASLALEAADAPAKFHFSDLNSPHVEQSELTDSADDAPYSFSEPEGGAISFAFSDELSSPPNDATPSNIVVAAAPMLSLAGNATLRADAAEDVLGAVKKNTFAEKEINDHYRASNDALEADSFQMPLLELDAVSPERIPALSSRPNSFAIPTPPSDLGSESSAPALATEFTENSKPVPAPRIARPSKKLVIEVPQQPATTPVVAEADATPSEAPRSVFAAPVNAHLNVEAGQTRDVNPNKSVRRVELQNREVCDAVLVGPHKLLLIGRMVGETRMAVWCDDEERPTLYQLTVATTQPTATGSSLDAVALRLTDTITTTYPQCRVRVVAKGDSLAVTGRAHNQQAAREIMRLVRSACLKTVHDELTVR